MMRIRPAAAVLLFVLGAPAQAQTTEFCLDGEFDLGARYQGLRPEAGEFYPARWCVTSDESDRVLLGISGNSNPDMNSSWSVAFLPPDLVRIVNRSSPPDIEFRTDTATAEAKRARVLDPRHAAPPDEPVLIVQTLTDLPLRGRVPVEWRWRALHENSPRLEIAVDGVVMFRGTGTRRLLGADASAALWRATPGVEPVAVPGDRWPSRVNMELVKLTDSIFVVRGVRTGFHHMVVETAEGLVVADAPAGWVELHQFPPTDLVPGLGISGLSEGLVDFLAAEFPGQPIRAVVLTHHHDDHAGGARAFAAAGASVYAPAEVATFLETALNGESMPPDRLTEIGTPVRVLAVTDGITLEDDEVPVRLVNLGESPHVVSSLGVLAGGYFFQSDLHVPSSDTPGPRAERALTECWFADWAVDNLSPDVIVINTHSTVETPVSRLARYLESPLCSGAASEP
jgi:glyoxylase-like metal-dependent hydrolase (beta-lactamase superfamily II)